MRPATSQRRTTLSTPPEASVLPSAEKATVRTSCSPSSSWRSRCGSPGPTGGSSRRCRRRPAPCCRAKRRRSHLPLVAGEVPALAGRDVPQADVAFLAPPWPATCRRARTPGRGDGLAVCRDDPQLLPGGHVMDADHHVAAGAVTFLPSGEMVARTRVVRARWSALPCPWPPPRRAPWRPNRRWRSACRRGSRRGR